MHWLKRYGPTLDYAPVSIQRQPLSRADAHHLIHQCARLQDSTLNRPLIAQHRILHVALRHTRSQTTPDTPPEAQRRTRSQATPEETAASKKQVRVAPWRAPRVRARRKWVSKSASRGDVAGVQLFGTEARCERKAGWRGRRRECGTRNGRDTDRIQATRTVHGGGRVRNVSLAISRAAALKNLRATDAEQMELNHLRAAIFPVPHSQPQHLAGASTSSRSRFSGNFHRLRQNSKWPPSQPLPCFWTHLLATATPTCSAFFFINTESFSAPCPKLPPTLCPKRLPAACLAS